MKFGTMLKGKRTGVVLLILSILLLLLLNSRYSGSICLIRGSLGVPCPGCGFTRSIKALLSGDISSSLGYHPLAIPILMFIVLYMISIKSLMVRKFLERKSVQYTALSIVLAVFILRLALYFPNYEPMQINNRALLIRLYTCIKAYSSSLFL